MTTEKHLPKIASTAYPVTTLPYNLWIKYIHKEAELNYIKKETLKIPERKL